MKFCMKLVCVCFVRSFHVFEFWNVFAGFPCCFIGAHLKWFWHKNKIYSPINSVEFIVCFFFFFLLLSVSCLNGHCYDVIADHADLKKIVFGQTLSLPFLGCRINVQARRFDRIIASETQSTLLIYEFEKPKREMIGPVGGAHAWSFP